jgi:uncharacterized protein (DUF362 family)
MHVDKITRSRSLEENDMPAKEGCPFSRRGFLLGSALGAAGGAGLNYLALRSRLARDPEQRSFTGRTREVTKPEFAMPGPFPGRVVEIHDPNSVNDRNEIQAAPVKHMMARGMCELTGADHPVEAWKRFFQPGDVVGIKVNPVGYKRRAGVVPSVSSPAVLLEIVEGLKAAGVKPRDMIVFERFAHEFREAGYEKVMRERVMDGVRWYAAAGLDWTQLNINGQPTGGDRDPHVVGYDPDTFVSMGFSEPHADQKDERRFRSHLSVIVSRMVNKFITIPVLKDHRSAGVTLALKNLSHGLNNNVARSHIAGIRRLDNGESGPNQCNTFIPMACSHRATREKATLHIMDGLIGCYEGGPGNWNGSWATWQHKSLFFATDPVAMDHVGWDIIDAKRAKEGWQPVAAMGGIRNTPTAKLSARLATLAAVGVPALMTLSPTAQNNYPGSQEGEAFDRRQPEHIILASTIGLGTFDARAIEHRRVKIKT